ncbi:hypothetical protein IXZ16_04875 [Campylobacter fetus subsp. fetus]|uniref:hypothetical protein n=1 Tax=Campylobacter fetus TaxID=196 RepID=UPI0026E0E589|nr:hypothetical protein [Campylobacter fetus]WKW18263.1 hypothetical protein IXZ16_04875 [Campylobacter fetus subsp. fetus]WKW24030.1 hypothetical protein IXZ12_05645 [Campylobacter fetus subsp. venerealis]
MHYFVYPNGGHSHILAYNLNLLGHTCSFLDDFKTGAKLEENLEKIVGGGVRRFF